MKTAKKSDWRTESISSKRITISLDRCFTAQQIRRIQSGLVPEQMEDKWFIYWEDDTLFFHRSWTGFCLFIVRFASVGDSYSMVEAALNRDLEQYKETDDDHDAKMISYLIDVLLLEQEAAFPSKEPVSEKKALTQWSLVGRAMLGQHTKDE